MDEIFGPRTNWKVIKSHTYDGEFANFDFVW